MKIAIHQPNYLPYIGYFQKMAQSDVFVLLDNVQFSKDSYTQRVKIKTQKGWLWLTIPVEKNNNFKKINTVALPMDNTWMRKHHLSIIANYSKSQYFDKKFIDQYYHSSFTDLVEFNEFGIQYLKKQFKISAEIRLASELNIDATLSSSDLIIGIMNELGGSIYISGTSGRKYLEEEKFTEDGIIIKYFEPRILEYKQRWREFQPYMSSIDMIFNIGEKHSQKFIQNSDLSTL